MNAIRPYNYHYTWTFEELRDEKHHIIQKLNEVIERLNELSTIIENNELLEKDKESAKVQEQLQLPEV